MVVVAANVIDDIFVSVSVSACASVFAPLSVSVSVCLCVCLHAVAANAIDNDLHYPINTVVFALIYCLFHLGMQVRLLCVHTHTHTHTHSMSMLV